MRFNICTVRSLGLGPRIRYGASRALDGYTIEYQAEWSTVPVFRGHRCQDVHCALDLGLTGMAGACQGRGGRLPIGCLAP